ncbi:DUF3662 and FHA domain-containing protein [Spelaeicoccus albus]|uniref:FHA domain-containing protein n=1 Tax=Spelaeicoccus albus TaxID=1280376 RepID=A0A7Z0ABI5_9MICO|nr:DUF3662 and FHA domain-containing protein [Spelaeicoccus albus]NYI66613.1 hypothetical protein [Spelaeicoccus albus]
MGVLDRFEKGIERAVNGAFAKAFRSEVQPVELAGALRREADGRAAVVSRGRTLTANSFTIELSDNDYARIGEMSGTLSQELRQVVGEHAASQGYSFVGPVTVEFEAVGDLDTGMYRVRSTTQRPDGSSAAQPADRGGYDPGARSSRPATGTMTSARPAVPTGRPVTPTSPPYGSPQPSAASPTPDAGRGQASSGSDTVGPGSLASGTSAGAAAGSSSAGSSSVGSSGRNAPAPGSAVRGMVEIDGIQHLLTNEVTVFGRSSTEADITLDDPGISRKHFQIVVDGTRATAEDLGSTNGTTIHGQRINKVALTEGAVLTAGRIDVVFHFATNAAR